MDGVSYVSEFWLPLVGMLAFSFWFWNNIDKSRRADIKSLKEAHAESKKEIETLRAEMKEMTLRMTKTEIERDVLMEIVEDRDPATAESRAVIRQNNAMLREISENMQKIAASVQHFEKIYKECNK